MHISIATVAGSTADPTQHQADRHTDAAHAAIPSSGSSAAFRQAAESTDGGSGRHRVKGFIESADEEASKRSGRWRSSESPSEVSTISTVVQYSTGGGLKNTWTDRYLLVKKRLDQNN